MCYITSRPTETWISKHILLVLFHNTHPILFLALHRYPLTQRASVSTVQEVGMFMKVQNYRCWNIGVRLNKGSLLLFSCPPPPLLLAVNSSQLPCEHRRLLIEPDNSKSISGVAETTQLMIYSLLILKTSGVSWGIVWAFLSDFWEASPFSPLPLGSDSPDRHRDKTVLELCQALPSTPVLTNTCMLTSNLVSDLRGEKNRHHRWSKETTTEPERALLEFTCTTEITAWLTS